MLSNDAKLWFLIYSMTIFFCVSVRRVNGSPIVGGQAIPADDRVFSFAVSLQLKEINNSTGAVTYKHFCGGALLQVHKNRGCVLTASHCVLHTKQELISVAFGANNLVNYSGQRFDNVTVYAQKYNPYTLENDFAILIVDLENAPASMLNPVRFIIDHQTASKGTCYIYGYGSERLYGPPTLELRLAPVEIISHELCLSRLGEYNAPSATSGMFCAMGLAQHVDACEGDSGSGLLCIHQGRLAIVGIISYGLGCGVSDIPGVYTAITHHLPFLCQTLLQL